MTSGKTLYKFGTLIFGFKRAILSISFYTTSDNCLTALDLIVPVVLNSVSGVNYHFCSIFNRSRI